MDFFKPKPKPEQPAASEPAAPAASAEHAETADASRTVDETAAEFERLDAEIVKLRAERDEAIDAHKRALADFQNYQRRAHQNERDAREQAVRGVLSNILSVVDHFDMALGQDPTKTTAAAIISGVTMIKEELLGALTQHGVGLIRPQPGDTFDATRHEAVFQQPAEGIAPGHVSALMRIGYTVNERVVRPAQVAVAPAAD